MTSARPDSSDLQRQLTARRERARRVVAFVGGMVRAAATELDAADPPPAAAALSQRLVRLQAALARIEAGLVQAADQAPEAALKTLLGLELWVDELTAAGRTLDAELAALRAALAGAPTAPAGRVVEVAPPPELPARDWVDAGAPPPAPAPPADPMPWEAPAAPPPRGSAPPAGPAARAPGSGPLGPTRGAGSGPLARPGAGTGGLSGADRLERSAGADGRPSPGSGPLRPGSGPLRPGSGRLPGGTGGVSAGPAATDSYVRHGTGSLRRLGPAPPTVIRQGPQAAPTASSFAQARDAFDGAHKFVTGVLTYITPRLKIVDTALGLTGLPGPKRPWDQVLKAAPGAILKAGIPPNERTWVGPIAKLLHGDMEATRRAHGAIIQWKDAAQLHTDAERVRLGLAEAGAPESAVPLLRGFDLSRYRAAIYPLGHLHVTFKGTPHLAGLFPPPAEAPGRPAAQARTFEA